MIRFGLVTVLYNSVDVLDGFFRSLAAQTYTHWRLEVIDNSPDEKSVNRARELVLEYQLKNVHFVRNTENEGVAKGNNQGIQNCLALGCDYVILLNNDIEFPNVGLFEGIVQELETGGYDIIAPKIYFWGTEKIWYGGGRLNMFTAMTKHLGEGKRDSDFYSTDRWTGYAPTCFAVIRSKVFSVVGMMDEKYFVYFDDTDFMLRCSRAGIKIRYAGKLSLFHKVSWATGGNRSKFSIYYGNRNRIYFIKKNSKGLMILFPMIWYFFSRVYLYFLFSGEERRVLMKAVREGLS